MTYVREWVCNIFNVCIRLTATDNFSEFVSFGGSFDLVKTDRNLGGVAMDDRELVAMGLP